MSRSKQIASSIIALAIVIGLVSYYKIGFGTSKAAMPPGGGGVQEIYVNNQTGNDMTGNGSVDLPYASPEKAIKIANGSFADTVQIFVTKTAKEYKLTNDIGFKRSRLSLLGYKGMPVIVGPVMNDDLGNIGIDGTSNNSVVGISFKNMIVKVNEGEQLTIDNCIFAIEDASKLHYPVMRLLSSASGGTPIGAYVNQEVAITRNIFSVNILPNPTTEIVGISAESIRDSVIALNTFKSPVWTAGIKITDAMSVKSGANKFAVPNKRMPMPLYLFDKTNFSPVYTEWNM